MVRYPVQEEGNIINKMTKTRETVNPSSGLKGLTHSQPTTPKKAKSYREENYETSYMIQSDTSKQSLWHQKRNPLGTKLRRGRKRAHSILRGHALFCFCICMALICVTNGQSEEESPGTCSSRVPISDSPLVIRSVSIGESYVVNKPETCPESASFFQDFKICYLNKTCVKISSPVGHDGTCPTLYLECDEQQKSPAIVVPLMPVERKKNESLLKNTTQNTTITQAETPEKMTESTNYITIGVIAFAVVVVVFVVAVVFIVCRNRNRRRPNTADYIQSRRLETEDSDEQIPMANFSNNNEAGRNGHRTASSNGDLHV